MKKIFLAWLLAAVVLTVPLLAMAQQPKKLPRIGYISGRDRASPGPLVAAFQRGLREQGYVEGENIVVEYRHSAAQLEQFERYVGELLELKVDLLVVPIQASLAKKLVKTTPIVMITNGDPVESGLVASLARPGGNITGFATLSRELSGKRLDLLKEIVPRLARVGILRNIDDPASDIKPAESPARALALELRALDVRGVKPDLDGAFKAAVKARVQALLVFTPLLIGHQKAIAGLAIKHRLPTMFEGATWVESGGLVSYSANEPELFRRAAIYVDKILKGVKPADLPVEQPTKFEFVINLQTAKAINLNIAQSVLFRADKVIK